MYWLTSPWSYLRRKVTNRIHWTLRHFCLSVVPAILPYGLPCASRSPFYLTPISCRTTELLLQSSEQDLLESWQYRRAFEFLFPAILSLGLCLASRQLEYLGLISVFHMNGLLWPHSSARWSHAPADWIHPSVEPLARGQGDTFTNDIGLPPMSTRTWGPSKNKHETRISHQTQSTNKLVSQENSSQSAFWGLVAITVNSNSELSGEIHDLRILDLPCDPQLCSALAAPHIQSKPSLIQTAHGENSTNGSLRTFLEMWPILKRNSKEVSSQGCCFPCYQAWRASWSFSVCTTLHELSPGHQSSAASF